MLKSKKIGLLERTDFISCIAVDDEPLALSILEAHSRNLPWVDMVRTFRSARAAVEFMKENILDALFLDINMPDISGLEIAELIDQNTKVIFTTAHPEYAIQGFDVAALDYLLKPIGFDRFSRACERIERRRK